MWKLTIQKNISKWPLQGLLSLLRTRKFVRQKTGAGGYLFFAKTHDTVPLNQGHLNKKSNKGRIITLSGLLSCTIFLFHNWSSFTKIISSFPSLQDDKTVLDNAYNWFGRLFFIDTRTAPWTSTRMTFAFFYSINDYYCPPFQLQSLQSVFNQIIFCLSLLCRTAESVLDKCILKKKNFKSCVTLVTYFLNSAIQTCLADIL
jgi:hypothetical protein